MTFRLFSADKFNDFAEERSVATGETEFGGVGGLIAARTAKAGNETFQQQCWEVQAANVSSDGPDGDPTRQVALGRVGKKPPRETYTPHWGNGDI
jgi:hypothetical protein